MDDIQDVLLLDKRQFKIHLSEFRLPVSARIFITITSRKLEIFIESSDHEHLFMLLRRLRKDKESSWLESRRHYEFPGSFRRIFDECRRLEMKEISRIKKFHRLHIEFVSIDDCVFQSLPSEIKITVFQPDILPYRIFVIHRKRQILACRKDFYVIRIQFHFTGDHIFVDHLFGPCNDFSRDLKDIFWFYFRKFDLDFRWIDGHLRDSISITKIYEGHSSQISHLIDSSTKRHLCSCLFSGKFSAGMRTIHNNNNKKN